MKVLMLGGTQFVGRHMVQQAQARGDEVTLFHRGKTNPGLFPGIEHVHGDRDGGLEPLRGRAWDVVIDTSGYVPRVVRRSAELLADAVDLYVFISSVSVYDEDAPKPYDENSPVAQIDDETTEKVTGETYGALKALCEAAAEDAMPGRTLSIRPGIIVGPYDPTPRFPYWVRRVAEDGTVLAPGDPDAPLQFIDARDLARWTLDMAERRETGVYNATGPAPQPITMGRLLDVCREVASTDAQIVWVPEQFLLERDVQPWSDLPLWIPEEMDGFMIADVGAAVEAGLRFTPLQETVRATLEWDRGRLDEVPELEGTLSREREESLLRAWREQSG